MLIAMGNFSLLKRFWILQSGVRGDFGSQVCIAPFSLSSLCFSLFFPALLLRAALYYPKVRLEQARLLTG